MTAKICVLGDSMSAQSYMWEDMWPQRLEVVLRQNGVDCEVRSFAINAHTFYRLKTTQAYGSLTALEMAVNYQPDIVIVVCGYNDTVSDQDSRTLAQVQQDATDVFTELRARMKRALIVYGSQDPYDNENFTTSTVKNKGVNPNQWTLNSSGILQDTYVSDILETACSAAVQSDLADWESLDTHIKALSEVDGSFTMNAWRNARLGAQTADFLHSTSFGHKLFCGAVMEGLKAVYDSIATSLDNTDSGLKGFFADVSDQVIDEWNYFSNLFDDILTDSGDGYSLTWPNTDGAPTTITNILNESVSSPSSWYFPYKWQFDLYPTTLTNDTTTSGQFNWVIKNGPPNTRVQLSIDGGAFFDLSRAADSVAVFTDSRGDAQDFGFAGNLGLGNGAHTFRFRVAIGDSKYQATDEYSLTLTA